MVKKSTGSPMAVKTVDALDATWAATMVDQGPGGRTSLVRVSISESSVFSLPSTVNGTTPKEDSEKATPRKG